MGAEPPFELSTVPWQTWAVILAGFASAGLALIMGRTLFTNLASAGLSWVRRREEEQPEKVPENAPSPDPFTHGSATERRYALRRPGKYVKVLVSDANAQAPPEQGCVLDRSLGGICFSLPHRVPENTLLTVRSPNAPVDSPWVQVQVKRCDRTGVGYWEVGCQFVQAPTWEALLQFG